MLIIFLVTENIEFWKTIFSRKKIVSVKRKVINHIRQDSFWQEIYWQDFCWPIYYFGKNWFCLRKIDFCPELCSSFILFLFCSWFISIQYEIFSFRICIQRCDKNTWFFTYILVQFLNILISGDASLLYKNSSWY